MKRYRNVHHSLSLLYFRYCPGPFISTTVGILITLLIIICVTLTSVLNKTEVTDRCLDNRCLFSIMSAPNDITCVRDEDCLAWTRPCSRANCSKEGTKYCQYNGAGDFLCVCQSDRQGRFCEQRAGAEHSCVNYCMNGGHCILGENNNYLCVCDDMWQGRHCQQRQIPSDGNREQCDATEEDSPESLSNGTWYEVARTPLLHQYEDACVRYEMSISSLSESLRGHLKISYLPLNRFSSVRSDWIEEYIVFQKTTGNPLEAIKQPYLHMTDDKASDIVYMSLTPFESDSTAESSSKFLTLKLCKNDNMYNRQTFAALLVNGKDSYSTDVAKKWQQESSLTEVQITEQDLVACNV